MLPPELSILFMFSSPLCLAADSVCEIFKTDPWHHGVLQRNGVQYYSALNSPLCQALSNFDFDLIELGLVPVSLGLYLFVLGPRLSYLFPKCFRAKTGSVQWLYWESMGQIS